MGSHSPLHYTLCSQIFFAHYQPTNQPSEFLQFTRSCFTVHTPIKVSTKMLYQQLSTSPGPAYIGHMADLRRLEELRKMTQPRKCLPHFRTSKGALVAITTAVCLLIMNSFSENATSPHTANSPHRRMPKSESSINMTGWWLSEKDVPFLFEQKDATYNNCPAGKEAAAHDALDAGDCKIKSKFTLKELTSEWFTGETGTRRSL